MAKVNREAIIEAATILFYRNGYHATSMQDVARAISIKKPSLYHHFTSKEAILLAILETGMDQLVCDLEAIVASDLSCSDKLRAAIRTHATAIAENPEGAAVFLREDRGLGQEYLTRYIEKRDRFEAIFRKIIFDGVVRGEFRAIDVPITVQALLGMVNWMTRWYHADGRLTAGQIVDQFAELILGGLSAKQ